MMITNLETSLLAELKHKTTSISKCIIIKFHLVCKPHDIHCQR